MPILESDGVVEGAYATPKNQERRVIRMDQEKGYETRGGNVKNEWGFGATLANPPSLQILQPHANL